MIVLDASVVLEVLLDTERGRGARRRILAEDHTLHAPHLVDVEVVHVLRRYTRAAQITEQRAAQAVEDLADLPMRRYPHDRMLGRIWQLRANLTARDAAYVALAEALDCSLLTCDGALAAAPGHAARVEIA